MQISNTIRIKANVVTDNPSAAQNPHVHSHSPSSSTPEESSLKFLQNKTRYTLSKLLVEPNVLWNRLADQLFLLKFGDFI